MHTSDRQSLGTTYSSIKYGQHETSCQTTPREDNRWSRAPGFRKVIATSKVRGKSGGGKRPRPFEATTSRKHATVRTTPGFDCLRMHLRLRMRARQDDAHQLGSKETQQRLGLLHRRTRRRSCRGARGRGLRDLRGWRTRLSLREQAGHPKPRGRLGDVHDAPARCLGQHDRIGPHRSTRRRRQGLHRDRGQVPEGRRLRLRRLGEDPLCGAVHFEPGLGRGRARRIAILEASR